MLTMELPTVELKKDAQLLLAALKERFLECHLELHPVKTKIVYCKDVKRKGNYPNTMFTFLGYDFRRRLVKNKGGGNIFLGFNPAVSKKALIAMRAKIRESGLRSRTEISLQEIAHIYNPILNGWIGYYGRFTPSALYPLLMHFNRSLVRWAERKYKNLRGHRTRASLFLQKMEKESPELFAHWKRGMVGSFG